MFSTKLSALTAALSPRRIARSLTTVLVLTFIQVITGPVLIPQYATPHADAATLYANVSNWQQWTNWQSTTSNHTPYWSSSGTTPISNNGDTMNLTQNVNNQDGSIWNTNTYSFSNDFSVSAYYYFGTTNGGADGIYFHMKSLGRWPNGGNANAANGTANSGSSAGITLFFDTYQNGNELANDHLNVNATNSSGTVATYATTGANTGVVLRDGFGTELTDVEDNYFHPFTILWRASSRTLSVYGGANADYLIFSSVIPATAMDGTNFSFGWQGITGGANNYQAINNVQYHLPATVTTNPTNLTVNNGDLATVATAYTTAEGSAYTIWQYSDDGGSSWRDSSASTTSYSFTALRNMSGRKYRFYISTTAFGTTHITTSDSMTLLVNAPPSTTGSDFALSLNGTAQYITAQDDTATDVSNAITLEAWVKPTALPANGTWSLVINKAASYEIGICTSNFRSYWSYGLQGTANTPWRGETTTVAVALDEWHHIAITRTADSSTVKFYYDGNLAYIGSSDVVGTGTLYNSSFPLTIGARYSSPIGYLETMTGQIDQVAIFGTARSDSEIKSDVYSYISPSTTGLQALYDFNEGSGSTVFNRKTGTTFASDLAIIGSAQYTDVKITETQGPYTVVKFPRTYLPATGGWVYTGAATKASVLVLGGGGAGGAGYQGGGGGAGGFIETVTTLALNSSYIIKVGAGGKGGTNPIAPTGGDSSTAFGLNALGGGRGASEWDNTNDGGVNYFNVVIGATSGGSGGGGAWGSGTNANPGNGTSGQGNAGGGGGGIASPINFAGGGGGGAGSAGETATSVWSIGGKGGTGLLSLVLNQRVAGGGGGASRYSTTVDRAGVAVDGGGTGAWNDNKWPGESGGPQNGTTNTGGGGGGSASYYGFSAGRSGFGGSGIVAIRWITATKPTYTKPSNPTIDVGQTETFTVNVANDSATAMLTRTFKWESTTAGANGTFVKIKEGTGADSAYFSWIPSDTSTTGSNFLFRLTVTDSDTAGLFISDSSTAYAIINGAMIISGKSKIYKSATVSKAETFTVSQGTPTFTYALSPVTSSFSIDTSTAGSPKIKFSDTLTVGTYYETLTVTDSVSATVSLPLTLIVVQPPTVTNSAEINTNGLIFNIDAANSASYSISNKSLADISGAGHPVTIVNGSAYANDYSGILSLKSDSNQFISSTGFAGQNEWTVDAYVRIELVPSIYGQSCIFTNENAAIAKTFFLCVNRSLQVSSGFNALSGWSSMNTNESLPTGQMSHVVATYKNGVHQIYINGVAATAFLTQTDGGSTPPAAQTNKIVINKGYDTETVTPSDMDLGYLRFYNRAFTPTEITNSYAIAKVRNDFPNQIKPTQKYGAKTSETFTVTAGSETKTVSFAVGNRTGITWDTSTAGTVKLSVLESITPGSYYDTITVTDNLGVSTLLPINFKIGLADTITVTADTATVMTYNKSAATVYPKLSIKGLVNGDSFTVSTKFSSSGYTLSATVPTNADTYTVTGADPVFTKGLASYYQNIVYETSTLTINKAKQRPLNIFLYGGTVGQPFLISLQGGDGDGAVTETFTGVSNIPNCSISNHYLSSTTTIQGFCEVRVVKAASQNYLAEYQTAQMYFMAFTNSQPTGQVGSGSTIAINGVTSFTVDTTTPPSISSLSATTISLAGLGTLVITGTGFGASGLQVKFYRNKIVTPVSSTATSITFNVADIGSAGATTGRVTVITVNGQAVSTDTLTINP